MPAVFFAQTPAWTWADGVYSGVDEYANDIAVDTASGNIVTVGVFNSDLSAFYGANFLGANGGGFVVKQDPNGNVIWAFPIGNNQDDACNGVAIDALGNIYVTGYVQNVADVKGTLAGLPIYVNSTGGKDIFIAKYNSAGQLLWSASAGGNSDDEGYDLCVNSSGAFVTGYYNGTASFGSLTTTAAGFTDNTFVAAYDQVSGSELWVASSGKSGTNTYGRSICADNADVFLIGDFTGSTMDVEDASGVTQATLASVSSFSNDIFIISYAINGSFNWAKAVQSSSNDYGHGIAQCGSSIYISGATSSTATFPGYASNPVAVGASGMDMFVAQLKKNNGNTQWVNSETGASNQDGMNIAVNPKDGVYVTGYLYSSMNFPGGTTITSAGLQDVFLAAYDTMGNFMWVNKGGTAKTDFALSVGTNSSGEVYIAGAYTDNAIFSPFTLSRVDGSSLNILTAKIGCSAITSNNVSSSQTVCSGQAPAILTGTNVQGGMPAFTYLWQESPDNISWAAATGTNTVSTYAPPAISSNTYYRRVVSSFGGCTSTDTSASILITVSPPPTAAAAGIDSTICMNSINLWGNTPTVGTGTWTLVSGAGVIASANSPTTAVSGLGGGTNVFAWTISNGSCPVSSDTVSLKVNPPPTSALAGPDQTICSPTYTLNANVSTSGTGAWSVIAGSGTVTSTSNPNSTANGLSVGVNTFVWTISTVCASSSDTVSITVDAMPGASLAGSDQTICSSTYTLNANVPSSGSGTWNVLAGGSTVSNASQNNSAVTNLSVGANTFEWVISNGTCPSSRDTVTISVDAAPSVANAGSDQIICSSSYTLNATPPAVGTGTWTTYSGGATVTSPTVANSPANNLSTGVNIFIWTTSNGVCPSSKDSVRVQVDAMPSTAFAGNPQTLCNDSVFLNATVPAVGAGNWNVLSGGATVSNPTQNNSLATGLAVGANTFEWVVSNGTCPSSRDTVTISVDAFPSPANGGPDQTICSSSYTLNASPPAVGTGSWTVYSGGATVTSPAVPNSPATNLSTGANIFIWTTSNGVCPSSTDSTTIQVDAMPSSAFAGNPQTLCNDSTYLSAGIPTVGTGTWSVVSGGGIVANPAQDNSLAYNLANGVNTFMWSVGNGVCPVSTSTVNVTVDTPPSAAFAGTDQTICSSTFTLVASAPTTGSGSWSVISGGSSLMTPNTNTTGVNNLAVGLNSFEWVTTNGTCPANRDTVSITVDANPSVSNAGNNQTLCASSTVLGAVPPAVGTGIWNVITGGGTVQTPSANNSPVNNLSVGANTFEWVISNGTCAPTRDTVTITVDANPAMPNAGSDQSICTGTATIGAVSPNVGTGLWSVASGAANVTSPTQNTTLVNGLSVGQNIFVWTVTNGTCPSVTDTVVITQDAMPSIANAGVSQNVCSGSANLNAVNPAIGTGVWTVVQGGSTVTSPLSNTSGVTGLANGINIFQWTVSNGSCVSNSDTVVVNYNFAPSPSNAGIDQVICVSSSVLSANAPVAGSGSWTVLSGSATVGSVNSPSSVVTGLSTGQNSFIWTITNGACPSSSDTVNVTVSPKPSPPVAGSDQNVCVNSSATTLAAQQPSVGSGVWTQVSGSGVISNPSQVSTGVNSLAMGQNIFVWTVSNSVCPSSSDSVTITVYPNPTAANAGIDQNIEGGTANLIANTPTIGLGIWSLVSGSGSFTSAASPATQVTGLDIGDNVFGWTISNGVCPDSYDEVVIHVRDLIVPNGFSPNGDHVNDYFEIPGLDLFTNIKLEVFNRWGNLVYENDNYKNDWDGKNLSGEDLTDDTYYFTMIVTKTKVYKGFVVLKRK